MDLTRAATPLEVALRIGFGLVVGAAATVDVWILHEAWTITTDGLVLRAVFLIGAIAVLGLAWAAMPDAALALGVGVALVILAQPTHATARGLPVGMFTQFAVIPVVFAAVLARRTWLRWPVATLLALAAASAPRLARETPIRVILGMTMFVLLAVGAAAIVYMHLRDNERRASIENARQSERLDLARELHDIVGHHVTGIVVLAQASRFTSGAPAGSPADRALAEIEAAGVETLTSLRRLVGLLRTEPTTAAGPRLADVERIVDGLRATHPATSLSVDEPVRRSWVPPDLATTVLRLVQEAATNVRRHGDPNAPVEFELRSSAGRLELIVENSALHAPAGGGYGLIGMRERVEALGGTFSAGLVGQRWRVHAVVPTSGQPSPQVMS